TQVMPRTAAWLEPGTTSKDLYDRKTNLRLGFRYLDQMIDKYKGDVKLALLAYNRGPGTVDKVLARGGDPDNGYADRVLGRGVTRNATLSGLYVAWPSASSWTALLVSVEGDAIPFRCCDAARDRDARACPGRAREARRRHAHTPRAHTIPRR